MPNLDDWTDAERALMAALLRMLGKPPIPASRVEFVFDCLGDAMRAAGVSEAAVQTVAAQGRQMLAEVLASQTAPLN